MPENILAVVEQRQGKLNRVSWETLVAGQALAAETGWTLEAAVVGNNVGSIAGEVAGKKVTKVYSVESAKFADQKDDPTASEYALEFLRKHPEVAAESVAWHTHDITGDAPKKPGEIKYTYIPGAGR